MSLLCIYTSMLRSVIHQNEAHFALYKNLLFSFVYRRSTQCNPIVNAAFRDNANKRIFHHLHRDQKHSLLLQLWHSPCIKRSGIISSMQISKQIAMTNVGY